jgi:DNA-binding protein H-NS
LTYPDLAQALQARILADLKAGTMADTPRNRPFPDGRHKVGALEAHIATLEKAVAKAEALGEQRRQEAETAAQRVEALEAHIATLEQAVTKAEALGEQRRQEAATAAKWVEALEANIATLAACRT